MAEVHVYTSMRNEAYMLPYFLRHYATVADRIFVLDDGSTDGSRELVDAHPQVTVLPYPFNTGLDDRVFQHALHEAIDTHSRHAAWVLCPDVDELLWHQLSLRSVLENARAKGVRCITSTAYFMVSDEPPQSDSRQLYELVRMGFRPRRTSPRYSYDKTLIFDPSLRIRLGPGRHRTVVPAGVAIEDLGVLLLHFCYLGLAYVEARLRRNCDRMLMLDAEAREIMFQTRVARARQEFATRVRQARLVL